MKRRAPFGLAAIGVGSLILAARGSSGSSGGGHPTSTAAFNQGVTSVVDATG